MVGKDFYISTYFKLVYLDIDISSIIFPYFPEKKMIFEWNTQKHSHDVDKL